VLMAFRQNEMCERKLHDCSFTSFPFSSTPLSCSEYKQYNTGVFKVYWYCEFMNRGVACFLSDGGRRGLK
jgi:hypothetical protein